MAIDDYLKKDNQIGDYLNQRNSEGWSKTSTITEQKWFPNVARGSMLIAFIVIAMLVVHFGTIAQYYNYDHDWEGKTSAAIVKSALVSQKGYKTEYAYTFRYTVDGKTYREKEANYRLGYRNLNPEIDSTGVLIIYNQYNPTEFVLAPKDAQELFYNPGKLTIFWMAIVGVLAFEVCNYIKTNRKQ